MKRYKVLIPLSHDHHHGLMLAQLIKKDAPEYKGLPNDLDGKLKYTLNSYHSELVPHFNNEEKILFHFISGKDKILDKLITEILSEHKTLHQIVQSLGDDNNLEEKLDKLGKSLEQHIRKEERKLFNMIQNLFSEEDLSPLEGKIIAIKNNECNI